MAKTSADESERETRAARFFDARKRLEQRERTDLTWGELGTRVAKAEGRAEPYADSVVRRWFLALSWPSTHALWRALGEVLGESPAWLAFGEGATAAPVDAAPAEPAAPRPRAPQIPVEMYVPARTAERRAAAKQAAEGEARRRRKRG